MTKNEYLDELKSRLVRLPAEDRDDVMAYYGEYFEDAGDDEKAIQSLGPAPKLAAVITADYSTRVLRERANQPVEQRDSANPYTAIPQAAPAGKNPYAVAYTAPPVAQPVAAATGNPYAAPQGSVPPAEPAASPYGYNPETGTPHEQKGSLRWIWYVVLGIFALPVALPIAIAIVAVMIALVAVCFALVAALIGIVIAVIAASVYILFASPAGFLLSWGSGLLVLGSALILLGIAMLLVPLFIKLGILLVRGIGRFFSWIYRKLKGGATNS